MVFHKVDPPFIDSISKYFSVKNMKLKRTVSVIKIQPKYPQNFLMNTPNSIEQQEITDENYDITPNSTNFPHNVYQDSNENPLFISEKENKLKKSSITAYESPDFVQRDSMISINVFKNDESKEIPNKIKGFYDEEFKNVHFFPYLFKKFIYRARKEVH